MKTTSPITRRRFMNQAALGGVSIAALAAMPTGAIARVFQPTPQVDEPERVGEIFADRSGGYSSPA